MTRSTTPAGPDDAVQVHAVIQAAFSARPVLDPPAPALLETAETVAAELAERGGLITRDDGKPVASLLFRDEGAWLGLTRVGVVPGQQHAGAGAALFEAREHGEREGGCLAGAGLRDAEHVTAGERFGYRLGLNGGGGRIAGCFDRLEDLCGKAQFIELH